MHVYYNILKNVLHIFLMRM